MNRNIPSNQYYTWLDKKIANARRKRKTQEYRDAIVNAIEFVAITGAATLAVFFGWLTLGALFG